jgi:hypothetical protein
MQYWHISLTPYQYGSLLTRLRKLKCENTRNFLSIYSLCTVGRYAARTLVIFPTVTSNFTLIFELIAFESFSDLSKYF